MAWHIRMLEIKYFLQVFACALKRFNWIKFMAFGIKKLKDFAFTFMCDEFCFPNSDKILLSRRPHAYAPRLCRPGRKVLRSLIQFGWKTVRIEREQIYEWHTSFPRLFTFLFHSQPLVSCWMLFHAHFASKGVKSSFEKCLHFSFTAWRDAVWKI